MEIFKNKTKNIAKSKPVKAPEEGESPGEIKHTEVLSKKPEESVKQEIQYREVPVVISRTQLDNMTIENNIMLKELLSIANE